MNKLNKTSNISHSQRKEEHLRLALCDEAQSKTVTTGLENYFFIHQALPELNLTDIDLSTKLFGKQLMAPMVISSMVGGIKPATRLNHNLAKAAQALGLAMGIGSQRCLIDNLETAKTFQVRNFAPDILLFANLGAVQLNYGFGLRECLEIIKVIEADALILHLNPLQEALQPEGNTQFAHLLKKIELICHKLKIPVIVKEVGGGISEDVARKLSNSGVAGLDVAGAGGTCWSEIERQRTRDVLSNRIAGAFASWGIPTAETIRMARVGAPLMPIIASGGIRTGLDVAKAIALGADAAGIATPLLKAATHSTGEVQESLHEIIEVLRIAMFCIGAINIDKLKFSPFLRKQ